MWARGVGAPSGGASGVVGGERRGKTRAMRAADRARADLAGALLRSGRIRSPAVEDAMRTVPRHVFLPGLPIREAYADEAVAVQHVDGVATSSASQPSMMAIMLEQLDLRPGHRVLEVGAGTGYNAALMAHIVGPEGAVTAVDIDADLVAGAARHLAAAGARGVQVHCADGALGYPPDAPYDRIVLTVGSVDVRPEWVAQLAPGGRLLLPLSMRGSQLSVALDLGPDGILRSDSVRSCAFIRLRGVAAGPEPTVSSGVAGLRLQIPDDGSGDPAAVVAALDDPGLVQAMGVILDSADVWDGFGLWLAVREAGTCRLLATDPDGRDPTGLLPPGGIATVALADPDGLAVVAAAGRRDNGRAGLAAVRAFGPGGLALADRLVAHARGWDDAGRPSAADLRLTVVPRAVPGPPEPGPGAAGVVEKEHASVFVSWAVPPVAC